MIKKRIFVGIPFDDEARRGVGKILKKLERKRWPVKWERVEKLHITLAFLGWMVEEKKAQVERGVQVAEKFKSFEVEFKGLGSFPDLVLTRVIWVGLKGDLKSLARLYKRVRLELEEVGFELEKRAFVGHVTLGRVKRSAGRKVRKEIGRQIGKLRVMDIPQRLMVDRVVVCESLLSRNGSRYKVIKEVKLR